MGFFEKKKRGGMLTALEQKFFTCRQTKIKHALILSAYSAWLQPPAPGKCAVPYIWGYCKCGDRSYSRLIHKEASSTA
jgi:hypothetical protein